MAGSGSILARLRQAREAEGMTKRELARAVGFSENDISRWEHGWHVPGVLNFEAVVNALGYNLTLTKRGQA